MTHQFDHNIPDTPSWWDCRRVPDGLVYGCTELEFNTNERDWILWGIEEWGWSNEEVLERHERWVLDYFRILDADNDSPESISEEEQAINDLLDFTEANDIKGSPPLIDRGIANLPSEIVIPTYLTGSIILQGITDLFGPPFAYLYDSYADGTERVKQTWNKIDKLIDKEIKKITSIIDDIESDLCAFVDCESDSADLYEDSEESFRRNEPLRRSSQKHPVLGKHVDFEKSEILSLWDGATNEQPSVSYGLLSTPQKLNLIRNDFKYTGISGSNKSDMLLLLPGLDTYVKSKLGKGKDFAIGASGENLFFGEGGRDVLIGGAGSLAENHLSGGPGKDLIISNGSTSYMKGGKGADTFVVGNPTGGDPLNPIDVKISDFNGKRDRLVFRTEAEELYSVDRRSSGWEISSWPSNLTVLIEGSKLPDSQLEALDSGAYLAELTEILS